MGTRKYRAPRHTHELTGARGKPTAGRGLPSLAVGQVEEADPTSATKGPRNRRVQGLQQLRLRQVGL